MRFKKTNMVVMDYIPLPINFGGGIKISFRLTKNPTEKIVIGAGVMDGWWLH